MSRGHLLSLGGRDRAGEAHAARLRDDHEAAVARRSAFELGMVAFRRGEPRTKGNPAPLESTVGSAWDHGWLCACFEVLERERHPAATR